MNELDYWSLGMLVVLFVFIIIAVWAGCAE
jgi:hypothetical protein